MIRLMIAFINNFLPYGVLVLQGAGLILLLGVIFAREANWLRWVGAKAVPLAFLITLGATLGSLFYSNIMSYEPCLLCWWQRLFMYPQVILFAVALWSCYVKTTQDKINTVFMYTIPLSIIGGLIAVYQILLPYLANVGVNCGATGVSCTKLYVLAFGYITIPVMSLTVFVILILLAIVSKMKFNSLSKNP